MTKYLPLLFAATVIFSCSQSSETSEEPNFSIAMDTVQVDSKGEILFLNYFLNISTLDSSQKHLYNFNAMNYTLEKVNMETLSLDSMIQLEREGPNGIGSFLNTIISLEDGGFLFSNSYTLTYLDAEGNRTRQITLGREPFIQDLLPAGKSINPQSNGISEDGKFMAGLYGNDGLENDPDGVVWFDLFTNSGKIFPTDAFDFITENNLSLEIDGKLQGGFSEALFFEPQEDKIIISSTSRNSLMIFDLALDSLRIINYNSQFTNNSSKPLEAVTVSDIEEFDKLREEKLRDVTFGPWELDQKTGYRWRFSKEMDRIVGEDSVIFKTVMTAIDQDFDLIGEVLLPENFVFPFSFRIREGAPYVFLNQNDELAFIRLKPNF